VRVTRRLRRDEHGFTLVELLAAMAIGMVVLFGTFALLDLSVESQAQTADRVDAVQRARRGMDQVTQRVRSITCLVDDQPALLSAGDDELRFYSSLDAAPTGPQTEMQQRTLRWEAADDGRIVEDVYDGAWDPAVGDYTFAAVPTSRVVIEGIQPVAGTPMFTFERRRSDTVVPRVLAAPVAAAELGSIGVVQVTFAAAPRLLGRNTGSTLESRVLLRTDDPTDEDDVPECA